MTPTLKSIHIEGFKKFKHFDMTFNQKINILVGENEAGKTTILDAIKLVMNQTYRFTDKSYLEDLFNKDLVKQFKGNPQKENLPMIRIDLEFSLDEKEKGSERFWGEHNASEKASYGISFQCRFDEESWGNTIDFSQMQDVPYEFYVMEWKNFSGTPYNPVVKPLHFLALDTSKLDRNSSFNHYNRTILHSAYEEKELLNKKHQFRSAVVQAFEDAEWDSTSANRRFGIDSKKLVLENLISILDDGVSLENHGSGMENLIKTQISLERANNIDVVLLEEPENHLSFVNLQKMIDTICQRQENTQLIIATHSSMVATRLDLRNVLWITENQAKSLREIKEDDAKFFIKLARNSFLQMLLAPKVILVEGITEYLLLPEFYQQQYGHSLQQDNIVVISCEGVSYPRYLAIAEAADKCVAVVTDNDADKENSRDKLEKINDKNKLYEQSSKRYRIFTAQDKDQTTWEICLYRTGNNKAVLNNLINESRRKPIQDEEDYHKYFKNAKSEFAYQILSKDLIAKDMLTVPDYIKEAFEWVRD